jgi:hypothetical protein
MKQKAVILAMIPIKPSIPDFRRSIIVAPREFC